MFKKIVKLLFPSVLRKIEHIKIEIIEENQKVLNSVGEIQGKMYDIAEKIGKLNFYIQLEKKYNEIRFWQLFRQEGESESAARKRFFLSIPSEKGALRTFQNGNAILLRKLKKVCEENDLKYWLYGGTLLGAIRHKGFVPWDDDIDIGMLRGDIEKIIEILKDSTELRISSVFDWYAKCHQLRLMSKDETNPCFVDIFFFDLMKGNIESLWNETTRQHKKMIEFFEYDDSEETMFWKNNPYLTRKINGDAFSYVDHIFSSYISKNYGGDKSDKEFILYGADNSFTSYEKNYFEVSEIFPLTMLEFESESYYVPKEYMKYMERMYGNIWNLPEDMISHFEHVSHSELERDEMQRKLTAFIQQNNASS